MKQLLGTCLMLFLLIAACTTEDDTVTNPDNTNGIVGEWLLIEQLADPGDGSGVFLPVTSNKTVEFFSDATFLSQGSLCNMGSNTGTQSTGTYDTLNLTIQVNNCNNLPFSINYELDNNHLIINYPCIEACAEKYQKVN